MSRSPCSALALALLLVAGCGDPGGSPGAGSGDERQAHEFLNQDPAVQYVGINECRQCHLGVYSTYRHTGMGRSFYRLTAETAVEDFTNDNELAVSTSGLRYRMVERDGKYYQRQFVRDPEGREVAVQEHELVFVVGSNNHNRSYAIVVDERLFQAPVCWYPQASKWELCPGYEHKNDNFTREISGTCTFCHNGTMQLVEGQRNLYRQPFPHGIDCERCHGPGQLHAERWSRGDDTPSGGADPTIVHPRRLTAQGRLQLCAQCHLGDARATERVARHGRELRSYRPGQRLAEVVVPFRYVEQTHNEFGLSAQVDRLMLSRCFTESGGRIECTTCHNPHVSVYDAERPADLFRRKCLTCHQVGDCSGPQHLREQTDPADDCVSCHMREAEPDDQRFTSFTDHWIRRDIAPREGDHRRSFDLEPVFPEDLAALPEGERLYLQGRAVYLKAMDAPPGAHTAMWNRARQDFEKAIAAGFEEADAWFFLGDTLRKSGRLDDAIAAFESAVARDPAHHDATFALGQCLAARGDVQRAADLFGAMLQRDPDDPMALAEAARSSFESGGAEVALEGYARAVQREPWNPTLRLNMARVLASERRWEEATAAGADALRLAPESPQTWDFYANLMQAAGKPEEARIARRQLERLRR